MARKYFHSHFKVFIKIRIFLIFKKILFLFPKVCVVNTWTLKLKITSCCMDNDSLYRQTYFALAIQPTLFFNNFIGNTFSFRLQAHLHKSPLEQFGVRLTKKQATNNSQLSWRTSFPHIEHVQSSLAQWLTHWLQVCCLLRL